VVFGVQQSGEKIPENHKSLDGGELVLVNGMAVSLYIVDYRKFGLDWGSP
jgi:hypothetical protein